jgi:carbon storage regulator CsrA
MLVLSRKVGEEIVLPSHGVTIGVVAARGGRVRLGIAAEAC